MIGKLASAAMVLTAVMASSMIISALSLVVVNRAFPTVDEFGRLALFYSLSWLYLLAFFLIGMLAVLVAHRRSLALLSAMGAWLVITFVVPQLTSGLRPTASLNPIVTPVGTSQMFFKVTAYARPFSVVEQYKAASGSILQTVVGEPGWHTIGRVAPIMCLLILLAIAAVVLVQRHDFSRGASGE